MSRPLTLALSALLLLLAAPAHTGEPTPKPYIPKLAGTWKVNADGTTFIMVLRQSGEVLSGEWYPADGKAGDGGPMRGSVDAQWLVKLRRHGANQNFEGYVFRECEQKPRHIAGFFGEGKERAAFRHAWLAIEQK